jgi:hypothetical protein
MASVPPVSSAFAQWLRDPALYVSASHGTLPAGHSAAAVEQEIISPLAERAAANSELTRQMAFVGGPLVIDRHVVKGQQQALVGRPVNIRGDQLGYDGTLAVFVLEAEELDEGLTALTVLRRL